MCIRDRYKTAWIGRVDTIPPQSDERTALIDRGLILRGLLTPAQIEEIHRIGDIWLAHHETVRMAEAAAHASAEAAIAAERERRRQRKLAKQAAAAARAAARTAAIAHRRATDIIFVGRGVSAGLADRRSHVEQLAAAGLPVLATPADLAAALGLTIPRLRWLCFHAEAPEKTHYVYFTIAKRSGGTRKLAAPHRQLATAQRWIFERILGRLPVTDHAHGFVAGRSTVTNARPHVGQRIVINLDLSDFFPTITFPRIRGLFTSLGYSPAVATLLALLTTEAPRVEVEFAGRTHYVATGPRALPQGACTSPTLANLVARKLDRRLGGATRKLGWTYTRYADDLTFSAPAAGSAQVALIFARVRAIVTAEGFAVNEAKGRVQRGGRHTVTGLVVIAALAAGSALISRVPGPQEIALAPFLHAGTVGAPIHLRTGEIVVDGVQASTQVRQGAITASTTGHWLVVTLRYTAADTPASLAGMTVQSRDGRTYSLARPFQSACGVGQPGVTIACSMPFELAPDALEGAHLRVPAALLGGGEGDDIADVDLGIDAATAARLAVATEPVRIEAVTVVGAQRVGGTP